MSVASVVENQGTKLVSDCGRSGITGAGHGICAWLGAEGGYPSQYQHGGMSPTGAGQARGCALWNEQR